MSVSSLDRGRLIFLAMILAVSMSFIDQTIVAIASHVFTARFTDSLVALGVPRSRAADLAASSSTGKAPSDASMPASMRTAAEHAVAHDYAVGMQVVLLAVAAALAIAFVIALRQPGDRAAQATVAVPAIAASAV